MALILSGGDGGNTTITGNSGNLTISNAGNVLASAATISASGNITGGNLVTAGMVSATGNVSGNNLNLTGNLIDTGAISIITGANGNITLAPNGTGIVTASSAISAVGNVTGGNILDSKGEIRTVPINSQTTAYTLVAADLGKYISTNANVTVPASVFNSGESVLIYNNSAASITVIQAANVTMYQAGTATTGNRTLAQRGLSTVFCVAANTFVISGSGLS